MNQQCRDLSHAGGLDEDSEGTFMQSLRRGAELAGYGREDLGGGKPKINFRVALGCLVAQ